MTSKCNSRVTRSATLWSRVAGHACVAMPRIRGMCQPRLRQRLAARAPPPRSSSPTGGTVRPVVRWGTDVMHRTARPVTSYDEELRALVADMVATMYAAQGVGLAACQIGVDLAVFVFDCPDESGTMHRGVVCNPVLELPEGRERRLDEAEEGCLSYPGAFVECARPDWARVARPGARRRGRLLRGRRPARALPAARDRPHRTGPSSATGSATGRARSCASRWRQRPRTTRRHWPVGEDVGAPGRRRAEPWTTR